MAGTAPAERSRCGQLVTIDSDLWHCGLSPPVCENLDMPLDLIPDSPLVCLTPRVGNVIVSAFLDVDGAGHPVAASLSDAFARLIPDVVRTTAPEDRAAVRKALAAMHQRVDEGFDRTLCHGVAMYASADLGLFSVQELVVPVETRIVTGLRPVLRPLELARQAAQPYLVLLVDRQHTRLLETTGGHISVLEQRFDEVPPRVDEGVWNGPRLQRHSDWVATQHVTEAARTLADGVTKHPNHLVLIGGPDRSAAQLLRLLDPAVNARLAGTISVPVRAGATQLLAAMKPVQLAAAEAAEVALVTRLRESARLTAGLEPVLRALWERDVATLAVDAQLTGAGQYCSSCGYLTLEAEHCPACSGTLLNDPDVVEAALAAAHAQRAEVLVCQPRRLDEFKGIAAVQRS